MIKVVIWDEYGADYKVASMSPKDIKDFVELIKEFGIWFDDNYYSFDEATYNPEENTFDINIIEEEQ